MCPLSSDLSRHASTLANCNLETQADQQKATAVRLCLSISAGIAYVAVVILSFESAQGLWAVGVLSALIIAATQVNVLLILRVPVGVVQLQN